ncbi:hypothetical protein BDV33DRAFT_210487 [Aspergillus novoparasiticus]|uniref:Uncharacterized protein n=1 Tax=Aspergillus novoparasiticus TaxID=986946 RepID=A0A5N6E6Z4_9EURO|nr:hypothetical protein BDV33DRAFT_210487 [Aspergillus novoparasiticus]
MPVPVPRMIFPRRSTGGIPGPVDPHGRTAAAAGAGPRVERARFIFMPGSGEPGGAGVDAADAVPEGPVRPVLRVLGVRDAAEHMPPVGNGGLGAVCASRCDDPNDGGDAVRAMGVAGAAIVGAAAAGIRGGLAGCGAGEGAFWAGDGRGQGPAQSVIRVVLLAAADIYRA